MLGWWTPENVSTDGAIFHLLYWSSAIGMIVTQMLFSRLRQPATARRTRLREAVWALVPALLLLSFGIASQRAATAIAAGRSQIALEAVPAAPASAAR